MNHSNGIWQCSQRCQGAINSRPPRTQSGSRTSDNGQCVDVACGRLERPLASNLVRQLKNLPFSIRRKRNLPPRSGILQDTVWHRTRKRVLDDNTIRHELDHLSGMRARPGTRPGFELDRHQAFGGLDHGSPGGPRGGDAVKRAAAEGVGGEATNEETRKLYLKSKPARIPLPPSRMEDNNYR